MGVEEVAPGLIDSSELDCGSRPRKAVLCCEKVSLGLSTQPACVNRVQSAGRGRSADLRYVRMDGKLFTELGAGRDEEVRLQASRQLPGPSLVPIAHHLLGKRMKEGQTVVPEWVALSLALTPRVTIQDKLQNDWPDGFNTVKVMETNSTESK